MTKHPTRRIRAAAAVSFAVLLAAGTAAAQTEVYLRSDVGGTATNSIAVEGSDNDWGTRCDRIINPEELEIGTECDQAPPGGEWRQDFGGGDGLHAGVAIGFRWDRIRFEVEFADFDLLYDETAGINILDPTTQEKGEQEIERTMGGVDDLTARNVFGNLYYDFGSDSATFRPFVGLGAGISLQSLDYWTYWKRNDNPEFITTFEDPLLRAKLAGTTTIGRGRTTDWVVGFQALLGIEWQLTGRVFLSLRGHGIGYSTFTSDPREWDELRSHQSDVGRGETIRYTVETSGNRFFGLTTGLKVVF